LIRKQQRRDLVIIVECLWEYPTLQFIGTLINLLYDSDALLEKRQDAIKAPSVLKDDYTEE
jgi:hypothetical protein